MDASLSFIINPLGKQLFCVYCIASNSICSIVFINGSNLNPHPKLSRDLGFDGLPVLKVILTVAVINLTYFLIYPCQMMSLEQISFARNSSGNHSHPTSCGMIRNQRPKIHLKKRSHALESSGKLQVA